MTSGVLGVASVLALSVTVLAMPTYNVMDNRVINFLVNNHSKKSNMPLSFKIPDGFWAEVGSDPDNVTDTAERILATYGLNLYDGACWQIALALGSQYGLTKQHTETLLSGKIGEMGLLASNYKTFKYGDHGYSGDNPYMFRMTCDSYSNIDPLTGKAVSWMDWKPVTGENAWLYLLGPLQAYILNTERNGGRYDINAPEVQLALRALDVFKAMQSPIGAVYYAPNGTYHLTYPTEIAAENNISLYGGLHLLREILMKLGDPTGKQKIVIDLITGIARFMKDYAYDKENGVFYQGGYIDGSGKFVPNPVFPLDVQTWGLCVFGEQTDSWFGFGTSYNIWQISKKRSGSFDAEGNIQGVGYTDGHDIVSGEWTLGAITMCRILAKQYETSKPEWSKDLLRDADLMRQYLESQRVDLSDSEVAYRYANKRYAIPFGWNANPVPSTASTAWVAMVDANFNPFYHTGEYLQPAPIAFL